MGSGQYRDRFLVHVHSIVQNPDNGQDEPTWSDGLSSDDSGQEPLYYWGRWEDLRGYEQVRLGYLQSVVEAKIVFHNLINLSEKDRLEDMSNNTMWDIDSITRTRLETIVMVHRQPTQGSK